MGSDRIMADPFRDRPSAEVADERSRVLAMLQVVIDDTILHVGSVNHPVATDLLRGFALEFVRLRKFVREGGSVEAFEADRKPPFAKEIGDGSGGPKAPQAGAPEQR